MDAVTNIFWDALSGPQARFAVGSGGARRFAPGFSPIIAFADQTQPDFESLVPFCARGEHFYTEGWHGTVPDGWRLEAEAVMLRMVWDSPTPATDPVLGAVTLDSTHVDRMMRLTALTRPGPFGPRTIELGDYFGIVDAGRLLAMAGERLHVGNLREISGVCTYPEAQGKGFARRLMITLIERQRRRGETPFLHVMAANAGACGLYERMGFRLDLETNVRVVARN